MHSLDIFNKRLEHLNAVYRLKEDPNKIDENYCLYIAKKKGLTKDDLPGKKMNTIYAIPNLLNFFVFFK